MFKVGQKIVALVAIVGSINFAQGIVLVDNFTQPVNGEFDQTVKALSPNGSQQTILTSNATNYSTNGVNVDRIVSVSSTNSVSGAIANIGINVQSGVKPGSSTKSTPPGGYQDKGKLIIQSGNYADAEFNVNWGLSGLDISNGAFSPYVQVTYVANGLSNANIVDGAPNGNNAVYPNLESVLTLTDNKGNKVFAAQDTTGVLNGTHVKTYYFSKSASFNYADVADMNLHFTDNPTLDGMLVSLDKVTTSGIPTPEPASMIPLAIGIIGLAGYRIKRRNVLQAKS